MRDLFFHLHQKQSRAIQLLCLHLELIFQTFDQPRELTLSISARVKARIKLIESIAHQVEPRPAVLLNRHIEGLLQQRHRVGFALGFRFGS